MRTRAGLRRHYGWELALLATSLAWGSTFVIVKRSVEVAPPMLFLGVRFAIAAALLAVWGRGELSRAGRTELLGGAAAGLALWAGYAFQTVGLQYTSASRAAFITGLSVVFVPVLGALALRRGPSRASLAGVALAAVGLALLARPTVAGIGRGEALVLACAASFAVQILVVGRVAPGSSPLRLAVIQLAVVSVASTASGFGLEDPTGFGSATVWTGILVTAVAATAVAFWVQSAAQRVVPPTRTAIIFASEPVFGGLFGWWLLGERLGLPGWLGAGLIVAGMLVAEVLAPAREEV